MEERLLKLPHSWVWLNVGEVIEKIPLTGKKLKQSEYKENGRFPVIDQGQSFIGGFTDKEKLRITVKEPVIIFGDHTKVFKYANFDFVPGADGVKVLRPDEFFDPKLFYYFLQSISLPEKGYARHFQWLEKAFIPLPPLPEQHRIVSKIEELFTKLDAGVEALKKVKAQLKRYRQAVLKYAFEGKLTQEWREANKDKLEPASVHLERIREEREKNAKGKLREINPLDTFDLPKLPKEWAWCRFGDVIGNISLIGKKLKQSEYQEKGMLPVIDQGQSFIGGYTDKDELKIKVEQPLIIFGDHTKVFKYVNVDFVAGADGIKVLKPEEFYNPKLFYYFAQAISLPEKGYARHFQWLEKSLIPLPPIYEQLKIKDEIESRLSTSDEMEKVVEQTLKQSERLRQSILKTAFEGKLVTQDPTDEPAEKLLERIKAEKAKKEAETKGKRKKSKQMELI